MTAQDILRLIRDDADSFYLSAADALPAFAEILAERSPDIGKDDMTTLIAIGTALYRAAQQVSDNASYDNVLKLQSR